MSKHYRGSFEYKKGLNIEVRNNNIDGAIRSLNRKVKLEGVIKDVRKKDYYEKPSVARRRKRAEAIRRAAKVQAKKQDD